jgi:small GTP-binding protein
MSRQTAKLVLLGDIAVGKTSITNWMAANTFSEDHLPTVGVGFQEILVTSTRGEVLFHVFDTAGEERFRSLAPMFCQNANVVLTVFDLTVASTFRDDIIDYFVGCTERASPGVLFYVVGNKADLVDRRFVTPEEAATTAQRINARYFETSALTGQGIRELFCAIAADPDLCLSDEAEADEEKGPRVDVAALAGRPRKKRRFC